MPEFIYTLSLVPLALILFLRIQLVALGGLWLVRRTLLPRLQFHDGYNDAIGGTVQAIGVFYGVTVGLIAVSVWNSYAAGSELASREASAIAALYRDVSMLPEPGRTQMREEVRVYTETIVKVTWPAQKKGLTSKEGTRVMDRLQAILATFEPADEGQKIRYAEALRAFNLVVERRRMRLDAVAGALSQTMWAVIWVGAFISIGVAYFFDLKDARMHATLVGLMAAFLALVVLMIVVNDRPFFGYFGVGPDSYQLVLDTLLDGEH